MTASSARALVVEHQPTAPPGHLSRWLPVGGLSLDVVRPYAGESLPARVGPTASGHAALVVLGGHMAAYDGEAGAAWLPAVEELLRAAVDDGLPTLGVCLGGQLLAQACGGSVRRGVAGPEYGVTPLRLAESAASDPLLSALPAGEVAAVNWHWDEIADLPAEAVSLAASDAYPAQAFRLGERAWGVQFHPEADAAIVGEWAASDGAEAAAAGVDVAARLADVRTAADRLERLWAPVFTGFAVLATTRAP